MGFIYDKYLSSSFSYKQSKIRSVSSKMFNVTKRQIQWLTSISKGAQQSLVGIGFDYQHNFNSKCAVLGQEMVPTGVCKTRNNKNKYKMISDVPDIFYVLHISMTKVQNS